MNTNSIKGHDWAVGGLALLLVIDLLELPWHEVGGGTVSGIALPAISNRATGPPDGIFGVLAVLATLAIIFDLLFEHLSPDTQIPAIDGSRTLTRLVLAGTAAALLALKFLFNISQIGNLGSGFWFGVLVTAALVYAALRAWQDEPARKARGARPAPEGEPEGANESEGDGGEAAAGASDDATTTSASDDTTTTSASDETAAGAHEDTAAGADDEPAETPETSARPES